MQNLSTFYSGFNFFQLPSPNFIFFQLIFQLYYCSFFSFSSVNFYASIRLFLLIQAFMLLLAAFCPFSYFVAIINQFGLSSPFCDKFTILLLNSANMYSVLIFVLISAILFIHFSANFGCLNYFTTNCNYLSSFFLYIFCRCELFTPSVC